MFKKIKKIFSFKPLPKENEQKAAVPLPEEIDEGLAAKYLKNDPEFTQLVFEEAEKALIQRLEAKATLRRAAFALLTFHLWVSYTILSKLFDIYTNKTDSLPSSMWWGLIALAIGYLVFAIIIAISIVFPKKTASVGSVPSDLITKEILTRGITNAKIGNINRFQQRIAEQYKRNNSYVKTIKITLVLTVLLPVAISILLLAISILSPWVKTICVWSLMV